MKFSVIKRKLNRSYNEDNEVVFNYMRGEYIIRNNNGDVCLQFEKVITPKYIS